MRLSEIVGRGRKMSQKIEKALDGRELDIKLTQLNADLQVYLAETFGYVAVVVAFVVFGTQIGLDNLEQLSIKTGIAGFFMFVALIAAIVAFRCYHKLNSCRNGIKNLVYPSQT